MRRAIERQIGRLFVDVFFLKIPGWHRRLAPQYGVFRGVRNEQRSVECRRVRASNGPKVSLATRKPRTQRIARLMPQRGIQTMDH